MRWRSQTSARSNSLSARQNVICKDYVFALPRRSRRGKALRDRSVRGIALQINQNATLGLNNVKKIVLPSIKIREDDSNKKNFSTLFE